MVDRSGHMIFAGEHESYRPSLVPAHTCAAASAKRQEVTSAIDYRSSLAVSSSAGQLRYFLDVLLGDGIAQAQMAWSLLSALSAQ